MGFPKVLRMARPPATNHDDDDKAPGAPVVSCLGCGITAGGLWVSTAHGKEKTCFCNRKFCRFIFFFVNLLLTPFLLFWHFGRAYVWPCFTISIRRLVRILLCQYKLLPIKYHDIRFPANDNSLGEIDVVGERKATCSFGKFCLRKPRFFCLDPRRKTVEWSRCDKFKDVEAGGSVKLFEGSISADDVCQGAIGNCWLISAIAAVAEDYPHVIKNLFITKDYDHCGVYQIRLYDEEGEKWRTFTIDDRIPTRSDGKPAFSQAKGNQVWVLLLEKAYAKMMGSYGELDGGLCSKALSAFTGNESAVAIYNKSDHKWHLNRKKIKDNDFFKVISKALDKGVVMCAGSAKDGKTHDQNTKGIAHGHAYTILDTYKSTTGGNKLIKLRNPWGTQEYTETVRIRDFAGMMSLRGRKLEAEDGMFWIPWDEFCKLFTSVSCCVVTQNVNSLRLDVHEHLGLCGPFVGMLKAFASFWFLCVGCRLIWWPTKKTTEDVLKDCGFD